MTRQLRHEGGGDPTVGPVPELAGQGLGEPDASFPDVPDANEPGHHDAVDQDKPDLDRFAERLGLRPSTHDEQADDDDTAGARRTSSGSAGRRRWRPSADPAHLRVLAAGLVEATAGAAGAASEGLRRLARSIRPPGRDG